MYRHLVTLIFVIGFYTAEAQPQRVIIVKPLLNYFINNTVHLTSGMNVFIITKQSEFRKMFGMAKTMDNKIVEPDFTKEDVIVIAEPATNHDMVITYTDAIRAGDFVEVYCKIEKKKYPLSYEVQHMCLGIIPKYNEIKWVKFYDQRRKLIGTARRN
jgi:hypothetical protein